MNKYTLTGILGQDPKHYPNDDPKKERVHFSVAVNENKKKPLDGAEEKTLWVGVTAFGSTAKYVHDYAKKGSRVLVEGPAQLGSYTNKDGVVVPTLDVVAHGLELFTSNGTSTGTATGNSAAAASTIADSDIPF